MRELCLESVETRVNAQCASAVDESSAPPAWYAVMVKHQHERPLESALRHKGFEALAPFYRTRKRWSDRVKEIELPLFPGYLFCHFHFDQRIGVLDIPGISRVVSFNGCPVPIPTEEIAAIRAVMDAKAVVRPWPHLKAGDRVRIERGALRGIEGTLLREKELFRLVIGIEMLQRSVAVEIDADSIVPVSISHHSSQHPPRLLAHCASA